MQVVILAGGLGTRLRPFTDNTPKVMMPVHDGPFLLHTIRLLARDGLRDIVLCIGYQGRQVRDFFGDGRRFGVNIEYSEEKDILLGTGGALKRAQPLLDDSFLLLNGDTYLDINYRVLADVYQHQGKWAVMTVTNSQQNLALGGNVETNHDAMVIRYDKEHTGAHGLNHIDAGALALNHAVLDLIESGRAVSLEKEIFPVLIARQELAAYPIDQTFYDIGTPERYHGFGKLIAARQIQQI